ncbi:cadherin-related family member 1-like [Branchiostoma floridae x Branchiostoma japonicum]
MLGEKCVLLLLAGIGITTAVTAPEFVNIGDLNNMLVSENTPVGQSIFQIRALDPDGNALDFLISGDAFRIDPAGVNAQGETLGDLVVAKILDRETNPVVRFDVTITDGLGGHQITHSDLLINVIDYNDNSPQFQGTPYEATLSESAAIGTEIITVRATDIDSGQNGAVNYQLTSHTDSFEIGQVDGILRLRDRTAIESEAQTAYAVTVRAVDGGTQPLATSVDVFVQITDEQNRSPIWLNEPYEVSITEGTPESLQGAIVFTVQAVDGDRSRTNGIRYELANGDPFDYFDIQSDTGRITLRKNLDREAENIFRVESPGLFLLRIRAIEVRADRTDTNPLQFSEVNVAVLVIDANDNLPRFYDQTYDNEVTERSVEITEHPEMYTPLPRLRLTVSDRDATPNNLFNLTLLDDPNTIFDIEPKNVVGGQAIVNILVMDPSMVDFETTAPSHQIPIRVQATEHLTNGGSPRRSAVTVRVNIKDAPETEGRVFNLDVTENAPVGTNVGTAKRPSESGIFYCLVGGNTNGTFAIDKTTGVVTVARLPLDRELQAVYDLVIQKLSSNTACPTGPTAYDPNDNNLSKALITITDQNDNSPRFTTKVYYAGVPASSNFNTPVARVQATDLDAGVNSVITYTITSVLFTANRDDITGSLSSQVDDAFQIDSQTGQILTNRLYDDYQNGYFTVNVRAEDGGGRFDDTEVRIHTIPQRFGLSTVLDAPPESVRPNIQECLQRLEDQTGYRVIYEGLQYNTDSQGNINRQQSQVLYYLIDKNTDLVLTDTEGLRVIEGVDRDRLLADCQIVGARSAQVKSDYAGFSNWEAFLIALAALLLLGLLLLLCLLCYCRYWYKKKMQSKLLVEPIPEPAPEINMNPVFTDKEEETQLAIMDFGSDFKTRPDVYEPQVAPIPIKRPLPALDYGEYVTTQETRRDDGYFNPAFTTTETQTKRAPSPEEPSHTTVFTTDARGTSGYTTGADDGEVVSTTVFTSQPNPDDHRLISPVYDRTYYEHEDQGNSRL